MREELLEYSLCILALAPQRLMLLVSGGLFRIQLLDFGRIRIQISGLIGVICHLSECLSVSLPFLNFYHSFAD